VENRDRTLTQNNKVATSGRTQNHSSHAAYGRIKGTVSRNLRLLAPGILKLLRKAANGPPSVRATKGLGTPATKHNGLQGKGRPQKKLASISDQT